MGGDGGGGEKQIIIYCYYEYEINHFMTLTLQVRWMSGGRRNFIQQVIDNVKQEFTKNKEMKVCEVIETMIL